MVAHVSWSQGYKHSAFSDQLLACKHLWPGSSAVDSTLPSEQQESSSRLVARSSGSKVFNPLSLRMFFFSESKNTKEINKHQEENKNPGSKNPGNKHARLEHQIPETNMPGWKTKSWKQTCQSWQARLWCAPFGAIQEVLLDSLMFVYSLMFKENLKTPKRP